MAVCGYWVQQSTHSVLEESCRSHFAPSLRDRQGLRRDGSSSRESGILMNWPQQRGGLFWAPDSQVNRGGQQSWVFALLCSVISSKQEPCREAAARQGSCSCRGLEGGEDAASLCEVVEACESPRQQF